MSKITEKEHEEISDDTEGFKLTINWDDADAIKKVTKDQLLEVIKELKNELHEFKLSSEFKKLEQLDTANQPLFTNNFNKKFDFRRMRNQKFLS